MIKWDVTENNGGGLTLNVFSDAYGNEWAHSGYEYVPGQLRQDIAALYDDDNDDTSIWDGNDLINPDIVIAINSDPDDYEAAKIKSYDADGNIIPLDIDDYYDDHETTRIIASGDDDEITIYTTRLGGAGKKEFLS